ncbi:MAG: GNAT family N-acetyltransferase [Candidatus Woesearchaeota archaeon]|nr:MAG: GNAT family N-acetyltransferase [Candidatus Woesearchaeota archaeon]
MKYVLKEVEYQPGDFLHSCGLKPVEMPRGGSHGVILGSFNGKKIVGCVIYTFVKKENFIHDYPENGSYIERICTDKKYRLQGIGKSLLEACIRDSRIQSKNNKMMYGNPLNWDAIRFANKSNIGIKKDVKHRNFIRERDREIQEGIDKEIEERKKGNIRQYPIVERDGTIVGYMPAPFSLENFDFINHGLEHLLGRDTGFNLIWHDISNINPKFFLKEGDLKQRKKYWKKRLKK